MRCRDYRAALGAELDAEAVTGRGRGLAEHGAACPECGEWLRAVERLQDIARRAPGPSEAWTQGLLGRLTARRD